MAKTGLFLPTFSVRRLILPAIPVSTNTRPNQEPKIIYAAVFPFYGDGDGSTISTHIKNIRSKFEEAGVQPIVTVWGIGYKWEQR